MSIVSSAIDQVNNALGTGTTSNSNTSGSSTSSTSSTSQAAGGSASQQLAGNFDSFIQLLTTQLQNQNPLDPLDTDQFTQELVEFSTVQQQIDTNTNLQTLISLQQASEATSALQLVGSTVTLSGNSSVLSNASNTPATWSINASGPGTGQVTITNSSGQTVYNGTLSLSTGAQSYSWNGQGTNGTTYPDGTYTLAITGNSASGKKLTLTTSVQGTISAVNASASPPTVTVNGQSYPISSIQSVTGGSSSLSSTLSTLNSTVSSLNSTVSNLAAKL
jgi:flagellar basal-body rod modification protein FlgD